MTRRVLSRRLPIIALLAFCLGASDTTSATEFDGLPGFWKGPGRIEFSDGSSEALVCKAYYATSDPKSLSIALRCASRSNKIELRAKLVAEGEGERLTGVWEERTFNASGTVTGHAIGGEIALNIDGGGFAATMLVVTDDSQQTVSISAQGVAFTNVNVALNHNSSNQSDERDPEAK